MLMCVQTEENLNNFKTLSLVLTMINSTENECQLYFVSVCLYCFIQAFAHFYFPILTLIFSVLVSSHLKSDWSL